MMLGIEATLLKLPIILLGFGREPQKAQEQFLIPGFLSFQQQRLDMIRQLVVLVAVVAANMFGYKVHSVMNQEPIRKPFQSKLARGVLAGDRVSVSVDFDAELAVDPNGVNDGRLVSQGVQRFKLF